ncbi:hypothetical protein F5148DRAFT_1289663 [Russula earlei]|uniref:Uncharacterized protein n=1 Tax=Russula earlei TaxID=71964 RepID=A0ACC0TXY6_9AGAM|nr:hypothetical protein F5148DRAFT_1289663 [Russula earlei]
MPVQLTSILLFAQHIKNIQLNAKKEVVNTNTLPEQYQQEIKICFTDKVEEADMPGKSCHLAPSAGILVSPTIAVALSALPIVTSAPSTSLLTPVLPVVVLASCPTAITGSAASTASLLLPPQCCQLSSPQQSMSPSSSLHPGPSPSAFDF